jgi:hypothetical protein
MLLGTTDNLTRLRQIFYLLHDPPFLASTLKFPQTFLGRTYLSVLLRF